MKHHKPKVSWRRWKKKFDTDFYSYSQHPDFQELIRAAAQKEIAARFGGDARIVRTESTDGVIVAYYEGGTAGADVQRGGA